MSKLGLRSRLLFSHIIVMLVGLMTLVTVGKLYSPQLFLLHLEKLEKRYDLGDVRHHLVDGFDSAWTRGAWWSLWVGGITAGGLSYLVSRRIMQPVVQMEKITQKFAQGELQARVPESEIPEFNRLAQSFNRMATNLEGVEQRRRELIGDLTHELRTPLTVLEGYLEGLADGTIAPSPDVYQRLIRETRRMGRLVSDTQELSKAEAGYLPVNIQPFDIKTLIMGLTQKFEDQLVLDGPALKLECSTHLPPVAADPERVEQILTNLLRNALRHTPPTGVVTIRTWQELSYLWIAVIDTGQGIASDELPHVFERFWRSDRSRTRDSGGSGLGLAISRRLVMLQGGEIYAESELNRGSTFRFSLPLA